MEENKSKVTETFTVNIKAILDEESLNEIADKLYDKLCDRLEANFRKAGVIE
jgi:hypothetical protein